MELHKNIITYAQSKNGPEGSPCPPLGLGHGGAAVGTTERYATVRFALVLIDRELPDVAPL